MKKKTLKKHTAEPQIAIEKIVNVSIKDAKTFTKMVFFLELWPYEKATEITIEIKGEESRNGPFKQIQFRFIKDRNYIWTKSDVNQKWFDTTYAGTASGFSISGFSAGAIIRTGDTPSISDITEYYRGPAERVEVAISKRMEVAATLPDATYLPEGYPAYCIYIAMGLNPEPEAKVLAKLKEWGNTMGSNLLVAPWNIGDISYRELVKKLEINQVPSLILTDDNNPDKNSLLIKIDDPADVNNVERLVEILPPLVNHILAGNSKRLLKEAIGFRQNSKVKSYLKPIASTLKRIKKLKIAADGFEIELS